MNLLINIAEWSWPFVVLGVLALYYVRHLRRTERESAERTAKLKAMLNVLKSGAFLSQSELDDIKDELSLLAVDSDCSEQVNLATDCLNLISRREGSFGQ